MPKRPSKPRKQKDTQQPARSTLHKIAPDAEPAKPKKAAPNKAKPPRPAKKRDPTDIERADSEGIAQLQGKLPTKQKNPAAVALGRLGGIKGGTARAAALTPAKRKAIAKKAAAARSRANSDHGSSS
jgi:hypothetical protein